MVLHAWACADFETKGLWVQRRVFHPLKLQHGGPWSRAPVVPNSVCLANSQDRQRPSVTWNDDISHPAPASAAAGILWSQMNRKEIVLHQGQTWGGKGEAIDCLRLTAVLATMS